MHPNLIIFDCDGTLIDSETLNNIAVSEGLMALGMSKYTPEFCKENLAGCSRQYVRDLVTDELGCNVNFDLLSQKITARCLELHKTDLLPTVGIEQLLNSIKLPKCVASNGGKTSVTNALNTTGLDRFFNSDHIFTGEMVTYGKPAPDIFLLAAKIMGHLPANCLVIEDSVRGVMGAKAAGMMVIGYSGGIYSNETVIQNLKQAGADLVVENMSQIIDILR